MRYFIDTEFFERPWQIDLISVGIVAEDDREFYAVNAEFDWTFPEVRDLSATLSGLTQDSLRGLSYRRSALGDPRLETPKWLIDNVRPHLKYPKLEVATIRERIKEFIDPDPSFWGYMCGYDWVVFCWIFGRMADKPRTFPYYCNELCQYMETVGVSRDELPPSGVHNALDDARWTKDAFERIRRLSTEKAFMPTRSQLRGNLA